MADANAELAGVDEPQKPEIAPLYETRKKVFPKRVKGTFRRLKWIALYVLLGIYWGVPWVRWDRGSHAPDQAVLIDMDGPRAYFFFIEIWPQEVYYLTGILILAAVGLFAVTSLFGRIWCGYACPQTVWTDLYIKVEEWIQGDRNKRKKLYDGPWNADKVIKYGLTHACWLVIALLTGGAFSLYFHDAPTLMVEIVTGTASMGTYGTIAFLTFSTYLLAGWAREQVCTYMCPWPRFQGAMLDDESYIVTYEAFRGEARGPIKRKGLARGEVPETGHCIDCNACVHVCPTGIDIRDGLQMECIGCGLCVDACNEMMDKVGFPRDLVRFDSVQNTQLRAKGVDKAVRIFRPRTFFYLAILTVVSAVMLFGLLTRSVLEINIIRDRQPLYVTLSDGSVRNGYTVKLLNMQQQEREFLIGTAKIDGAQISTIGESVKVTRDGRLKVTVAPDQVGAFRIFIKADPGVLEAQSSDMLFTFTDPATEEVVTHATTFVGPAR